MGSKLKLGKSKEHYKRFGIEEKNIVQFEDGLRTTGESGTFEWWYLDADLEGGAKLVIQFATKIFVNPKLPLTPIITVNYTDENGILHSKATAAEPKDFSASKEGCNVKIGNSYFRGNLHKYEIHVEIEDMVVDLTLTGTIPAWRPSTGVTLLNEDETGEYAWLVAVPQGDVDARIMLGNEEKQYHGTGYHDHDWGNTDLISAKHHSYWGRATAGDFTFITSYTVYEKQFDYESSLCFMLSKDGSIIADDENKVTFHEEEVSMDEETGKPIGGKIIYHYKDGDKEYRVIYCKEDTIFRRKLTDLPLPLPDKIKENGCSPAYLRFSGTVTVETIENGKVIDSVVGNKAIWESMQFGDPDDVPKSM